jgi:hypothetical protein
MINMAIQQWTMKQWRLVHEMIHGPLGWKLSRFRDKDLDDQIDVWLEYFCPLETAMEYRDAFGGSTSHHPNQYNRKGEFLQPYSWILKGKELDDFLDNLWIMLSRTDPHGRLTDVRQSQDIRSRVREGNSYPFYDPRSAKRR